MFFFSKESKEKEEAIVKASPMIVNLWRLSSAGMIIYAPTNVFYSNQTGGYGVYHPQQEGLFVPLSTASDRLGTKSICALSDELYKYFGYHGKWKGHCYNGIDEETAVYMDELFLKYRVTEHLRVDRDKLSESHEAWVHITLHYPDPKWAFVEGLTPFPQKAIFTWPNSD